MSDSRPGPGWWQASDDKWYAPEQHPDAADTEAGVLLTIDSGDGDRIYFATS